MPNILQCVATGRLLISDSATGTWFQHAVKSRVRGECCDQYNVTRPDTVRELYRAKIGAGADLVLTNTFNSTPMRLREFNLQSEADAFNAAAVHLLRQVIAECGREVFVGGNVGPTGSLIGQSASYDEVLESMRAQIRALVRAGVDILCLETIFQSLEAQAAVEAAREVLSEERARVPLYVTFAFMNRPDGTAGPFRTFFGDTVTDIMEGKHDRLADRPYIGAVGLGVDVVGANCSIGIEDAVGVTQEFTHYINDHGLRGRMLVSAKPNSEVMSTMTYEDPAFASARFGRLVEAGAHFVGFCCGSTPDHIAAVVRRRLELLGSQREEPRSRGER